MPSDLNKLFTGAGEIERSLLSSIFHTENICYLSEDQKLPRKHAMTTKAYILKWESNDVKSKNSDSLEMTADKV